MLNTLLAATLLATAPASAATLPARVQQAIRQRIADHAYPALVIVVVDGKHGHIYGFGKLANGKAPDARTEFEIGSITKTFTATLLARAVEQKHLQLDTPAGQLLPGFRVPTYHGHRITLGDLASQHSALPRIPSNLDAASPDPYAHYGARQLKTFLASYQLTLVPGSHYAYSNLGVGLLGYALGRKAGHGYADALRHQVLQPLGLHATGVALDARLQQRLAGGHDVDGKPTPAWHFAALAGAGGLRSDGTDMLRYLEANMGRLHTPLDAAMRLAQKPRVDGPGPNSRVGLVWMTSTGPHGGKVIWHNGMTGGYASFIGFSADRRHGVVILTNAQHPVDDLGMATLLPGAPLAAAHKRVAMTPKALRAYVGAYQLAPHFLLHVLEVEGHLYAQATGQAPFPIFAGGRDRFFANVGGISLSFERGPHGGISGLVLHQHGDHPAPRIDAAAADAAEGHHRIELPSAVLKSYVGRYRMAGGSEFRVSLHNGQLQVRLGQQRALPVFASARDHFFYRAVDAQLDFERDAAGHVSALVLHQAGAAQRAQRIAH